MQSICCIFACDCHEWDSRVWAASASAPVQAVTSTEGIWSIQLPTRVCGRAVGGFHPRWEDSPDYIFPLMHVCFKAWLSPSVLQLIQVNFKPFFFFHSALKKLSFHKHSLLEKVVLRWFGYSFLRQLLLLSLKGLANFPTSCLSFDSLFIWREKYLI